MTQRKRLYLLLLVTALGTGRLAAQNDPVKREMTIESEFTPIVKDASKMNMLPEVEQSQEKKSPTNFSNWSAPALLAPQQILLPATDNPLKYPFSQERGYAFLKGGNYANIDGGIGYRILQNKKNDWNVQAGLSNTNGTVGYNGLPSKTRMKNLNGALKSAYKHTFTPLSLMIDASYRAQSFNYYGLPLDDRTSSLDNNDNRNQLVQEFNSKVGIASHNKKQFGYAASIGYNRFGNKLGVLYDEKGAIENHIQTKLLLKTPIDTAQFFALNMQLDNLFYERGETEDYTLFTFNPYWKIEREKIKTKVGAVINFSNSKGPKVRLAPDVEIEWMPVKMLGIYGELTGGKELNTMAALSKENFYQNPSERPRDTYTAFDFEVGLRTNPFPGFSANIYAGYVRANDMTFNYRMSSGGVGEHGTVRRNVVDDMSQNVYAWKAGANLKYKFNQLIETSLSYKHNAYHLVDGGKSFNINRPKNEINAEVIVRPIEKLALATSYYFAGGRTYLNEISQTNNNETGKLQNIKEWNLGASYRIIHTMQVTAELRNILNNRYDLWYGMPAQGIHFLVGASVNF